MTAVATPKGEQPDERQEALEASPLGASQVMTAASGTPHRPRPFEGITMAAPHVAEAQPVAIRNIAGSATTSADAATNAATVAGFRV